MPRRKKALRKCTMNHPPRRPMAATLAIITAYLAADITLAVTVQQRSQLRGGLAIQASMSTGTGTGSRYTSEHGFCELCMHTIHQVQYGALPSCAQSPKSFGSCSQVVQVILANAAGVLQLIEEGCYQYDSYKDWQTIQPCPSHAICGRLHNQFDVDFTTLCPKDFHYRFPNALAQVSFDFERGQDVGLRRSATRLRAVFAVFRLSILHC